MKKLFLTIIALATVTVAAAQNECKSFYWGVKTGVNYSGTIGKGADASRNSRMKFTGGLFAEKQLCERWSMITEALYSQQGYVQTVAGTKTEAKFDYINIPVLTSYRITNGLAAKAGVQFGIPMNGKDYINGSSNGIDHKPKFDFSIPVGIAYNLDMGLFFDIRYNIGLSKVYDNMDMRNSVAALTVGWRF